MPQSGRFFSLQIGSDKGRFAEASGLDEKGGKAGNVTLRKGIFACDGAVARWFATGAAQDIVISLEDEAGTVAMSWEMKASTALNTTLESEGNEVAVESVDIAFETMVISAP